MINTPGKVKYARYSGRLADRAFLNSDRYQWPRMLAAPRTATSCRILSIDFEFSHLQTVQAAVND